MPRIRPTENDPRDIVEDIYTVIETSGPGWLASMRWLQRKDVPIGRVKLRDLGILARHEAAVCVLAVVEVVFRGRDGETTEHSDLYNVPLVVVARGGANGSAEDVGHCTAEDAARCVPVDVERDVARDVAQDAVRCSEQGAGRSVAQGATRGEGLDESHGEEIDGAPPLARITIGARELLVYDATETAMFAEATLESVKAGAVIAGVQGAFEFHSVGRTAAGPVRVARKLPDTSTNTLVAVDSAWILKVYRRMVRGKSPDLEMSVGLTQAGFGHMPAATGYAVYKTDCGTSFPTLLVQQFVPNRGEAWKRFLAQASAFIRGESGDEPKDTDGQGRGPAARLGEITAELHCASGRVQDEAFRPADLDCRDVLALERSLAESAAASLEALRRAEELFGPGRNRAMCDLTRDVAGRAGDLTTLVRQACRELESSRDLGKKIRIHGDLHLGQFLAVERRPGEHGSRGEDFVVLDFEGEPLRPVEERRLRASPLRDVAGMQRSFDYVACSARLALEGSLTGERGMSWHGRDLSAGARAWSRREGEAFLHGYLRGVRGGAPDLVPSDERDFALLLTLLKLEKALYEVRYELGNRPAWVEIPLAGVLDCMAELREVLSTP